MGSAERRALLDVHLAEYAKLKDEQLKRIGYRDSLVYATLIAMGGITSFVLGDQDGRWLALLALPLVSGILGWMYLINDEKVSDIGWYLGNVLARRVAQVTCQDNAAEGKDSKVFGWQTEYRQLGGRAVRKCIQLAIHEGVFVGAGVCALVAFWLRPPPVTAAAVALSVVDSVVLAIAAVRLYTCRDIR